MGPGNRPFFHKQGTQKSQNKAKPPVPGRLAVMQTCNRQPGPGCGGREALYPAHWLGVCKPFLKIM